MIAELLEPIAGENPAGANLRYDPVYDQIKQARIEEDDAPQGEWRTERKTADYALVIKLATQALSKRTKDLQLAAWLTEAKLKREGIAGLAEGLDLTRELVEQFWEGLYPEVDEGDLEYRAAPLEWLGQYLAAAVRAHPLSADGYDMFAYRDSRRVPTEAVATEDYEKAQAREQAIADGRLAPEVFDKAFDATPKAWYKAVVADIATARAALDALRQVTDDRFGDVSPNLGPLRDALDELKSVVAPLLAKKLEKEPDPVVAEPAAVADASDGIATGAAAGGPAGAAPAAGGQGGGLPLTPRDREDAVARLAAAARFLRAQAPGDPAPFLVLRGLRWGELRASSPLDPTLLSAPPTEVRSRLKGLLLGGRFPELLEACEDVMAQPFGRGWLDLQRYVVAACEGCGYDAAAAAILGALRTLLHDIPELPDQTLMDDTPTANAETRAWLHDRGLVAAETEEEPGAARASVAAARDALGRAEALLRAGDKERAIRLLLAAAEQEKSARARFLRRSQAARVMVESGFEAVALPILQEMTTLIEKHTLEEWESGETVAQPLGLLYRCLDRLGYGNDKEALYLRICRLDPLQAMKFASSTASDVPSA